ncbi:50S ribosomal protein L11 methyltransferase [Phocicoccus pinnipedialis]|uniref:Ribosomal protein L11 methyltransferase n=1 Tax=Phocicoccus pinnipedialis TaxID=110845 RepID=A0A6V7REE0_9BACL|nr:50S ribosomal protein L11 methyltransferase [Jeotgalicoccus pinnipedialis]MBP1939257.1 ribosomal protein L11 methyltransferase [Jeotgalicoccus pinnipedialis]CAD2076120.1 Ribosomal protein L11 methyltransferase [Jeotgalicoccus pinnipedialis]
MNWHKISINTSVENEEMLTEFLTDISNGISVDYSMDIMKSGVEDFDNKFRLNPDDYPESDIRLTVYFDESVSVDQKLAQIRTFIEETKSLVDKDDINITQDVVKETDWENEWKKYFHSFRVSETFMIVPSWELDDHEIKADDRLIKLDPGMAFGTGDHPTTSMCLKFIEKIVKPEDKIIDVGTGSGILTIGSHLMGARDLTATDIDELSLKVARENLKLNDIDGVEVRSSDLLKNETRKYTIVMANILAHVIEMMITDAYNCLIPGGHFISSGIIVEKKEDILTKLESAGFTVLELLEDNGWISILAKKED